MNTTVNGNVINHDKFDGIKKRTVVDCRRTGNIYSIAASEFIVTFDDGRKTTVWSGPWNDFDPEEEERGAIIYAEYTTDDLVYVTETGIGDYGIITYEAVK